MPDTTQPADSRRDFLRGFGNKRVLRSLGQVAGAAMGLISRLRGQDSCEAAGMAIARKSSPLSYEHRSPLAGGGAAEGGNSSDMPASSESGKSAQGGAGHETATERED